MTAGWTYTAPALVSLEALSSLLFFLALGALASAVHSRRLLARVRRALQRQQRQQPSTQAHRSDAAPSGLPQRQQLRSRLQEALQRAQRSNCSVGLLLIGVEYAGAAHDAGDRGDGALLLREVAARLRALARAGDSVLQLCDDQFAIVLADMQQADNAALLAARVLDALAPPLSAAPSRLTLRTSLGVGTCPGDGDDADALLQSAGAALQRASAQAGNCADYATAAMGQRASARIALEQDLYHALDGEQFELYYQPQLSLETGRITGVEALLRWHHPRLGLLAPGRFLAVAEASGQIVPIGAWVLRTACAQAAAWHRAGFWPTLCVNVSLRQLQQSLLAATVQQALAWSGIDPAYLELELTERTLLGDGDPDATLAVLRQLRQLGVCVALDNFGSGATSLSLLTRFPIDVIKIDRGAVSALPDGGGAAAMVVAMIALARALGQKTVAEGVETLAQLDFLDQRGCDAMQGHYFSAPLPADAMTLLLEQVARDYPHRLRDIAATARKRSG